MQLYHAAICVVLLLNISYTLSLKVNAYANITIWPLPEYSEMLPNKHLIDEVIVIDQNFHFNYVDSMNKNNIIVTKAIKRYEQLINIADLKNDGNLKSCDISVNDGYNPSSTSIIGADESYNLVITEMLDCSITGKLN